MNNQDAFACIAVEGWYWNLNSRMEIEYLCPPRGMYIQWEMSLARVQ